MQKSLFLTGGRCAGKSFVGRLLAEYTGYHFFDTDDMICNGAGLSIEEIVRRDGWPEFRRLENLTLHQCCSMTKSVIATGGGAVMHEDIWPVIRKRAWVIWLTAPVEVLIERIKADTRSVESRPSLTGVAVTEEYAMILQQRKPLYERVSHHVINTDSLDRDQIVADIVRVIGIEKKIRDKK